MAGKEKSMTLYEINQAILELVDPETGELADYEAFDALQMEREAKIENTLLYWKNLVAEAQDIREEEKNLAERRKAKEKRAESLKQYVKAALAGEKFETSKVKVSYRRTAAVHLDETAFLADDGNREFVSYSPTINKVAIRDAIKQGRKVTGAELVESQSMTIK